MTVLHDHHHISVSESVSDPIDREHTVNDRRRCAERHQRIHIRRLFRQCLKSVLKIFLVCDQYRHQKQDLGKRISDRVLIPVEVLLLKYRSRDAERFVKHMPHGNIH